VANQRLLEGEVVENNGDDSELNRLRELNRGLTRELHDALDENDRLRKRVALADAPIARLRENLAPFYQLLQTIFGDIDELAPDVAQVSGGATNEPKSSAVWEEWKARFPGAPAKVIAALQKHRDADTTQLCVLIGTSRRQTVADAIHKLNKAGLINKNGGRTRQQPVAASVQERQVGRLYRRQRFQAERLG
jgi:hypothetical protein